MVSRLPLIEEENDENQKENLVKVCPKSTTPRSRLNSASSTSSKSRPNTGISTRTTTTSTATASGAVDETIFEEAFETTQTILISSGKDVENHLANIREILADTNNDWEKRVDALKKFRSLIASGADDYDEFFRNLRQLDLPLVATVKDLRSQIVREVCITLSYMSIRLNNRFDRTAENVLPAMINLIQNSAKVISTSGAVANRFIVTNTQSIKLIPLILTGTESKSKEIRRHSYELLVIILSNWDFAFMEKHGQLIHDAIKRGLSDADADARSFARKSFSLFREHFTSLAEILLASLDASKRKTLMGEMSNASSTHSLASIGSTRIRTSVKSTRLASIDKQDSTSNLARSSSANELALRKKNAISAGLNTSTQSSTGRPRALPTAKPSTRPSQTVSQSTPGSRSTSPRSIRSSQHLSSTMRTPTNARSRVQIGSNNGSRISSRESSPGRTPGSSYAIGSKRRYGRKFSI